MSTTSRAAARTRARTWSSFGNLGRKPSEYEVVTHAMNHTFGQGREPLEMGPDVHGNVWLKSHRDAHVFGIANWDGFRDPDEVTYRKYCQLQDEQETYVDGLLNEFTAVKGSDAALAEPALQFLGQAVTPTRYLGHGLQMLSAYLQQMAPSSYVATCAALQTADALRRVQRVAYRTKQLDNAHPLRGFGLSERGIWEDEADWQPARKAIELQLVEYDFDRAFAGLQLCLKPVLDSLFLGQVSEVARSLGDELDALIADNLRLDAKRSQRWTAALVQHMRACNPESIPALRALVAERHDAMEEVITASSRLLARHATAATRKAYSVPADPASGTTGAPTVADAIAARVREEWKAFLGSCELGSDA